jgi:alkane 1-monooxygenase
MFDHLKYLSCFYFPVCVVCFLLTAPHGALDALLWTNSLWLLIAFDWLSPKVQVSKPKYVVSSWYYDAILYTLVFFQCLIISLLLIKASQLQWNSVAEITTSIVNLIVMRILVGTSSGSSAIIVAHELIHRPKLHLRLLGRLLLYTVCYDHFVIAHMRGHHFSVATPEDIATAKLGESFKTYWRRILIGHFKYAWNSEMTRLGITNKLADIPKIAGNSVFQGLIVEFSLLVLIVIVFGWVAALIFLYQALSGVRLLETINYYQHWGLEQGKVENTLAWVNQSALTEYALVGLSNHISHHQDATKPFYNYVYSDQGPKMPYGYFVTNLWVKLNNESYRRVSTEILKKYL